MSRSRKISLTQFQWRRVIETLVDRAEQMTEQGYTEGSQELTDIISSIDDQMAPEDLNPHMPTASEIEEL